MRMLAVDTSAVSCSVAVIQNRTVRAERTVAFGQSHNRHLMPLVQNTLAMAGVGLGDLDLLAVTRGPGSFTGVRIGLATVQGLALASGKPVVAVSSLEALAFQAADNDGPVAALIDARRGEVYQAVYRAAEGRMQTLAEERVLSPEAAAERIPSPCRLVGSGIRAYAARIGALLGPGTCWGPPEDHLLRAASVARLALKRMDQAVGPEGLVPCYLRPALTRRPEVVKA